MPNASNNPGSKQRSSADHSARKQTAWLANYWFLAVVLTLGSLARIHQLGFPVSGPHDFRQTQTAFAVRGIIQQEGNPLFAYLPVFGEATQVPFELPIFQMLAAQVSMLGASEAFSGRLVSLFMFQVSAILTWVLAKHLFGLATANVSIVLFQFSPFGMVGGASFLIESTALAFTMGAIISLEISRLRGGVAFVPLAMGLATLAFLVKITTPIGWFVGYFAYLALTEKIKWSAFELVKKFGPMGLVGLLGVFSGVAWSELANEVKRLHPLTDRLTSSSLRGWNFGTIEQRLDPGVYLKLATTPALMIFGLAIFLIIPALLAKRGRSEWKIVFSLTLVVLGNIIFFINLYYVHEYYFMAIYPALAAIAGWAVSRAAFSQKGDLRVIGAFTVVALASTWLGPAGTETQRNSFAPPQISREVTTLRDNTTSSSRIVAIGCDWNPALFYHSNRTGLMIPGWYTVNNEFWEVENLSLYTHLVTCGDAESTDVEGLSSLRLREVSSGFLYSILK